MLVGFSCSELDNNYMTTFILIGVLSTSHSMFVASYFQDLYLSTFPSRQILCLVRLRKNEGFL